MYLFYETLTIFDLIYFEFIYKLCKTQVLESIKYWYNFGIFWIKKKLAVVDGEFNSVSLNVYDCTYS